MPADRRHADVSLPFSAWAPHACAVQVHIIRVMLPDTAALPQVLPTLCRGFNCMAVCPFPCRFAACTADADFACTASERNAPSCMADIDSMVFVAAYELLDLDAPLEMDFLACIDVGVLQFLDGQTVERVLRLWVVQLSKLIAFCNLHCITCIR